MNEADVTSDLTQNRALLISYTDRSSNRLLNCGTTDTFRSFKQETVEYIRGWVTRLLTF